MNFITSAAADISHLQSQYFTAKRFNLPFGQISLCCLRKQVTPRAWSEAVLPQHNKKPTTRICRIFVFNEDTLSLRLVSKLPDLRSGYANQRTCQGKCLGGSRASAA